MNENPPNPPETRRAGEKPNDPHDAALTCSFSHAIVS